MLTIAFKTDKGTFTLSGSSMTHDEYKNLDTKEFFKWKREAVNEWVKTGKVQKIEEAKNLIWYSENKSV